MERQLFAKMASTFLLWRDRIRHPRAEQAVRLAMINTALILTELIIFDRQPQFKNIAAVGDDDLRAELPRAFLAYLGISTG